MDVYRFEHSEVSLAKADNLSEIRAAVDEIFRANREILPGDKDALVFLKPNLNNDLNALMGNSTDLRIIAAVVDALKKRGYGNIVVGDGCNVGIDRKGIDVFSRLKIDRLAKELGFELVDLNKAAWREEELTKGEKVKIADICFDSDLFINLPKLKTHTEAGLTLSLKNMIGCLRGGQEKKKVHNDLIPNILRLNEILRPHLHIMDGLVAMEGNGPGDGTPRKAGMILAGKDPYLVDALCSRVVGFEIEEIPYLVMAKKRGVISERDAQVLNKVDRIVTLEKPPRRKLSTRVLGHNMFMGLREAIRPLFSNVFVTRLLYKAGIIQDVYDERDATVERLFLLREDCDECGRCLDYCPMGLAILSPGFEFSEPDCIGCLYCAFVCPKEAIRFDGELGYLSFYLKKYSNHMRKL